MGFGDRLKKLREQKGITQKELGRIINISDRVIGYYESNNRFPKDEYILKKLADFFEVSIDYLVDRSDNNKIVSQFVAESVSDYGIILSDLPEEAVEKVKEYVELMRLKYSHNINDSEK